MTEQIFATRLGILMATIVALTILNAYIPHELAPIRTVVAAIQLIFMIATMAITVRWVLEEF